MVKKPQNSLQKGFIRYIIFKDEGIWYGVGMEFNIIESADTPQEALFLLLEATRGYLKSAAESKARVNNALNQKADPEYEWLWDRLQTKKKQEVAILPQVFTFGTFSNKNLVHA